MSRTYEDLQVAHPVNIFEDYQQNLFEDDNNLDQAYLAQTGAINPQIAEAISKKPPLAIRASIGKDSRSGLEINSA